LGHDNGVLRGAGDDQDDGISTELGVYRLGDDTSGTGGALGFILLSIAFTAAAADHGSGALHPHLIGQLMQPRAYRAKCWHAYGILLIWRIQR
jgi:hypothetical protein